MRYRYLLFALLFLATIAVVYVHYYTPERNYKDFKQFEENSTDKFENKVEHKLEVAGCQKPKYYTEFKEDQKAVCFDCNSYDMCMEYDDFSETPYNKIKEFKKDRVYFKGDVDQEKTHAIRSNNLTRKLNCGCTGRTCKCENKITATRLNDGYVYTYEGSEVIGGGRDRSVLAAYKIDEELGGGQCSTTTTQIKCQNFNADKVRVNDTRHMRPIYP
ncbi:MAG: hypothetical protein BRC29_03800 [Nanohaloarchaea archaeon SW_7_43_1]|nr:MAG: hypothetical protein BRC29_03800 [Nanohaloarchaea archaeon SW_7_43_1]